VFTPDQQLTLDASRAAWREIGNEAVVLDTFTATCMSLNSSARALWKRLDTGATPEGLAAEPVPAYDIPAAQAETDVGDFLAPLQQRSLLSPDE
jgi:hypothetical protein